MIRVGVIGYGFMGKNHRNVLQQFPDVSVTAIADCCEAARQSALEIPSAHIYAGYQELLRQEDLDAVHICLPDNLHTEAFLYACRTVPNIFLEKPAATSISDLDVDIQTAQIYGTNVAVGHIVRHDIRYQNALQDWRNGKIGTLCTMAFRRNSPISGARKYSRYASLPLHVMLHDIDIANLFAQSVPLRVFAAKKTEPAEDDTPFETMFATVEYQSGAVAQFEACWALPERMPFPIVDEAEWIGTRGYLRVSPCFDGYASISNIGFQADDTRYWPMVEGKTGGALREELRAFIDGIHDGTQHNATLRDAKDAIKICLAIEEAATQHVVIRL